LTVRRRSRQNPLVREFILRHVAAHPGSVGSLAAKEFKLSRTAINRYMQRLLKEGLVTARGKTTARKYSLKNIVDERFEIKISVGLSEDAPWRFRIFPLMKGVKQNVVDICHHGFTEILNNAIDHSGSPTALISYQQNHSTIKMMISDDGIGIFQRIQRDFNLPDARSALLELSKGKLTSDKKKHAGEGIFFTSRMFDEFSIRSGDLFYTRQRQRDFEWLIESGDLTRHVRGTAVFMTISTDADWTTRDIFNQYQGDDLRFRKTHVPVKLGRYPDEQLVSRSQAKRVLARFESFSEVLLDFEGVPRIGQAFADEIFRVFPNYHPKTRIVSINASPEIEKMIEYVRAQEAPNAP
jgi:anti-sigma regulatory factor (Ser/Thr protein kinase)